MADDEKNPLFSERVRDRLLLRRILVLDGVLDDDNGTLLATQLLTLAVEDPAGDIALWIHSPGDDSLHDHWYTAAEAREYGFIDEIVGSFGQIMPARRHRIGLKGDA